MAVRGCFSDVIYRFCMAVEIFVLKGLHSYNLKVIVVEVTIFSFITRMRDRIMARLTVDRIVLPDLISINNRYESPFISSSRDLSDIAASEK